MNITDTLTGTFSNSLVVGANVTNLKGGWDKVWGAITSGWPGLGLFLTMCGVAIAVIFAFMAVVKARRNEGSGYGKAFKGYTVMFIVAGILAAPAFILPVMLGIIDIIINVFYSMLQAWFGVKK